MLINNLHGQECRIAIVDDGLLQELYIERSSSTSQVGNIYKGKITNIEPGIQAAFVDFGTGKNGFLHISDVHPQHFSKDPGSAVESVGQKRPQRSRPPIQQFFKRGREVVVQLIKEGIGTKGPTLTTYLSIPGRMLVMMPGMGRLGVSRKIEDEEARAMARASLAELKIPDDMGFIVRTAGMGRSKRELQRDLNYLLRLWKSVKHRIETSQAPAAIYQESDLVVRTIRDIYNSDIKRVICDTESDARKVREFVDVVMPRGGNIIEVYTGREGLFQDAGLEDEIESMYARRVELPSGGSLVIDQTEALVAIDINSGRMREHANAEDTALKTNLEAAVEIARQLRIRDLGGMVVMDFIDMNSEKNRHKVEKALKDAMKPDRAKSKVLRMDQFGLVAMTRQRMRPSLEQSIYRACEHCNGAGLVKSEQSQTIHVMRALQALCANEDVASIRIGLPRAVSEAINNQQRQQLRELECSTGKTIAIQGRSDLGAGELAIDYTDKRGNTIDWAEAVKRTSKGSRKKKTIRTASIEQLPADRDRPVQVGDTRGKADGPVQADMLAGDEPEEQPAVKKPRRRGRRGGRKHKSSPDKPSGTESAAEEAAEATPAEKETDQAPQASDGAEAVETEALATVASPVEAPQAAAKKSTKRKRSSRKRKTASKTNKPARADAGEQSSAADVPAKSKMAKKTKKARKTRRGASGESADEPKPSEPAEKPESAGFESAAEELADGWPLA